MDARQALADLTEISSQIHAAVVFDGEGKVAASTLEDSGRADELAREAARLIAEASAVKTGDTAPLTQLEAATPEGSVFVVRKGQIRIAATTAPEPSAGLVFYDLKTALHQITREAEPKPAAKRPVRASGPGEGAPGEPGGSPATKKGPRNKKKDDEA